MRVNLVKLIALAWCGRMRKRRGPIRRQLRFGLNGPNEIVIAVDDGQLPWI